MFFLYFLFYLFKTGTARPQTQTIAVQCNMPGTQSLYASSEPPPLVPTQSFAHLSYPHCSDVLNISTHNAPPRTPLIIRTAVTTATSNATPSSAQENNQLISNNSFGSLIDPNFSVSKLIVLNSNESVQKHQQQSQQPHLGIASNDNQILSQVTCLPPSVNSLTESTDDQLYFDSATGQLTFPVYLANDAVITNFLINNEIVGQQLQTNSSLAEDSVALPEPAADMHLNPIDDQNNEMTNTKKDKAIVKSSEPPSSANSYLLGNKTTPACGIINPKACKSLSTPRKRASHVRTLTFSPRGPQLGLGTLMTPLSTRREHINRFQRTFNISNRQDVSVEQVKEEDKIQSNSTADTSMVVPEKPIIKNVEILPTISATSNHVINENSSSSCNVPPLFIHEESSNQTVINGEEPKLVLKSTSTKSETNATVDNTPKRQQSRKNAVRACKRQIPPTSRVVVKKGKNNTNSCEANNKLESEEATTKNFEIEAVEEWRRLRNVRINNFDMHIREENAKMSQFKPGRKISTKRRIRRRKSAALKRKEKEIAAMAEESMEFDQVGSMDGKIGEYAENKQGEDERNVNLNESHFKISNHSLDGSTEILDKNEHKSQIKDKHSKFNIKIPTPQKAKESEKCKEEAKAKLEVTEAQVEADSERYEDNTVEYEKSTANIGVLLETPPKVHSPSYIPPTPGIFAPSLNTPSAKLNDVNNAMSASASFLFGSITKSELDTPLLSAVTPGSRFTFGLKEGPTPPRSNSNTECSSGGGSYYKPDESENLDQNIDQLLKNSGQKKPPSLSRPDEEESIKVVKETEKSQPVDNVQEGIEVEISVEKLRVEADVLKRVKPLGSEQVEIEDIDPHYTLASGLPEISAAEEEDSSSSSSSSSTSSSSSSSSSANSSRNSSSSSSSSNCSSPSKTTEDKEKASSNLILADLDNLSSISSTEGDEWQELQLSDNDENSQLISNDGEVRYPLRSWLTPIKENLITTNKVDRFECGTSSREIEKQTTIKVTLPLKATDKKHKESKELEMKRERLKEKLKTDASIQKKDRANSGSSAAPNILAARSATRIMHAMRDKGKKSTASPVRTPTPNNAYETREDSKRSMEVLTALNLSAKKQAPKTIVLRSASSNESKNRNLRLRHAMTNSNHPPQRRCLPIEARPVTRNICKTPGKKFVRTPLSFKSGHQTLALTSQKLLNEKKQSIDAPALRVSPRLRKTIQRTGKKTIVESPPIKSKINVKVSKPKVAVAKVKKTLKYNKKKLATPKGRKKHLSEDSEDDEEEEDKPLKCMKVPVKPKIHVKAKNYMISKKIKKESDKSDNKIQAKKQTQNNEESKTKIKTGTIVEINDNNIHVTSDINKKCSNGKETATNDHVDQAKSACGDGNTETALEVIDEDDDILEDCELVSIDETDTKRFICIKYEGPDEPPPPPAIKYDLSNVMHVDIDQNETHTWSVTETILLYSCEPNSSCDETQKLKRNKAKKLKKVRINDDRRKEDEKQEVSRKSRSPIATSTPVLARKSTNKISTSQNDNCKQQLEGR